MINELRNHFKDTAFEIESIGDNKFVIYLQTDATLDEMDEKLDVLNKIHEDKWIDDVQPWSNLGIDADRTKDGRQALVLEYIGETYAKGGSLNDINWKNFTLDELYNSLKNTDIQLSDLDEKRISFNSNDWKKIKDTAYTISDAGSFNLRKSSENLYLDVTIYPVDGFEEHTLSIYTKDNHDGLKKLTNQITEQFEKGGSAFSKEDSEILEKTIVYDNDDTLDRYTVFTPDGYVYGMSSDARGFNQFLGDSSEIEKGSHLGKKLKSVPKEIENAILNRMKEEYSDGGEIDTNNIKQAKKLKIKSWYIKTYPTDDLGEEMNEEPTFWSLWSYMNQGYDAYNVLGVADSLVRERVFGKLSEVLGVDYEVVYNKWLNSKDSYEDGGDISDENAQMVLNNSKQIEHHTKELSDAVKGSKHVPAWVVAKVNRSASDLSDATHYLDGENDKYAEGGSTSNKIYFRPKTTIGGSPVQGNSIRTYTKTLLETLEKKNLSDDFYYSFDENYGVIEFSSEENKESILKILNLWDFMDVTDKMKPNKFKNGGDTMIFTEGEIVWDSGMKTYGVVLDTYGNQGSEIRLDSDGNRPKEDLHKLGSAGDKGTKKQLAQALNSHKSLLQFGYDRVNYADGGELTEMENDKIFNKVYDKYNSKDYWDVKGQTETQLRNWKSALDKGDKNAEKYTEQQIRDIVAENNKVRTYYGTYLPLVKAINTMDKNFLQSRVRYDQKVTREFFEELTNVQLPKTNKELEIYFNSVQSFKDGGELSKVKVGDTIYRAWFTEDDGEKFSMIIVADNENQAEEIAKANDPYDKFSYVSNPIKITSEEQLFEETRNNEVVKRYADGGETEDAHKKTRQFYDNVEDTKDRIDTIIDDLKEAQEDDSFVLTSENTMDGVTGYNIEGDSGEYLVFESEDEAERFAVAQVKEDMEEDISMFNQDFLMDYVEVGNFFSELFDEMNTSYAEDIKNESDDRYENRLIAEMVERDVMSEEEAESEVAEEIAEERIEDFVALMTSDQLSEGNRGLDHYRSNFGDEEANRIIKENNLIDIDGASKGAVEIDGIAHFLAGYDHETVYLDNGAVAYRTN